MADDEKILKHFKANRMEPFYSLVYPSLLVFASSKLGPKYSFLAEDCVQDAVFAAYQKRDEFYYFSSFRSFLYTCIHNKALNILRKDRAANNYLETLNAHSASSLSAQVESREILRNIFNMVDTLPEHLRRTFELSFVESLSNAEVAEQLCISVSAVKKRKAAIRVLLDKELNGEMPKAVSILLLASYFLNA